MHVLGLYIHFWATWSIKSEYYMHTSGTICLQSEYVIGEMIYLSTNNLRYIREAPGVKPQYDDTLSKCNT